MLVAPLALALALAAGEKPAVAGPAKIAAPVVLKVKPALPVARQVMMPARAVRPIVVQETTITDLGRLGPAAVGGPGDENVLKSAKVPVSDDGLLDFFRKRTPPAPAKDRLIELAKALSVKDSTKDPAKDAAERDAAQGQLVAIGEAAVPLLRQTANNVDDIEASTRAKSCLQNIEGGAAANLAVNAARLLAMRKPAGAAEVLIGYLPYAEDETTFLEVEAALVAVALVKGKADPAVVKALKDKIALRRGAAAHVLCQAGGAAYYSSIRPLLKDERPSVRLKAALGLVAAYDSDAIPVLIDLLAELPPRLRQQAEEYLTNLAGEWAVSGPKGNDLMSGQLRRDVWNAWWKNADGSRLLEEFKSRTTSDEEYVKIIGLIAKLGDPSAEVRDNASTELVVLGKKASSLLRRAVSDNRSTIGPSAAKCLEAIEKDTPDPLPAAAPRLLALRRPEGTIEALMSYLPFAESEDGLNQIVDILVTVGSAAGKGDAALVKALKDPIAVRRASAAMVLCRAKAIEHLAEVRQLLKDPDAMVQLRAAQCLAALGEKLAIPTLIGLLKVLPLEHVWEVEEFLARVAGDKTPNETVGTDAGSRAKAVVAWTKWWAAEGKTIDLASLDLTDRERGLYLIVENMNNIGGNRGRVLEVDSSGRVRWEIPNLNWPNDAQLLRNGNVLIIEQQNRVTERTRDKTNKIVWDKFFQNVFHAERLLDGNTFLAQRNQIQIVDKDGKSIFNHFYNLNTILAARRFRDGSIAYVSYSGHYVRLDRSGKQVKTLQMSGWNFNPSGAEILPGDRVVVSSFNPFNKVHEFDATGKQVWECPVFTPAIPFRLSNGHTIVASNNNTAITEIDRGGKIVKEWKGLSFQPYRVIKR